MKGDNLFDNLKAQFGRVYLRHDVENRRSIAVIVNDTALHVGISKRHEGDQMNRRVGRLISLGRAKRAHLVYTGKAELRTRDTQRAEPLFFTIEPGAEFLEKAIEDLLTGEFFEGLT